MTLLERLRLDGLLPPEPPPPPPAAPAALPVPDPGVCQRFRGLFGSGALVVTPMADHLAMLAEIDGVIVRTRDAWARFARPAREELHHAS